LASIVDYSRCLSDATGDVIVLVERWQAIILQPGYVAFESKDAECGELKGVRL
jgi:hypothetical protein